jgi:phosphoribosyl 1,2-cyclic phosphodiesterase
LGTDDNVLGIIDAGTGIRKLGKDIMKSKVPTPNQILIGFTHFHWDHIQGFPFFNPAYHPSHKVSLIALGEDRGIEDLKRIFEVQMQSEYFPVPLRKMAAQFEFLLLEKASEIFNRTRVTAQKHQHPGGAYSYKFERNGKSMVISTDIEHGEQLDKNIIDFARNADLLIHDAQYTKEQLEKHRGWGHSSYDQAMELAKIAKVKQLVLTHHDPDHDDDFLDKMEIYCQERFPGCLLAKEGLEILI